LEQLITLQQIDLRMEKNPLFKFLHNSTVFKQDNVLSMEPNVKYLYQQLPYFLALVSYSFFQSKTLKKKYYSYNKQMIEQLSSSNAALIVAADIAAKKADDKEAARRAALTPEERAKEDADKDKKLPMYVGIAFGSVLLIMLIIYLWLKFKH
jgi:Flp pilus assembly protein TadB